MHELLPPDLRETFSSLAVCFGQGSHLPYFCLFFVKNNVFIIKNLVDLKRHGGILMHIETVKRLGAHPGYEPLVPKVSSTAASSSQINL